MTDLLAGSPVTALDTPPSVTSVQGTTVTTTSATFTTSGADCAVVFTAPTTGKVKIFTTARMINATTSGTLIGPETRTGSTIGSGTVIESASAGNGPSHYGASFARIGVMHLLTGLTPGAVYNTRLLMSTSNAGDTASFANRELSIEPAT